MYNIKCFLYKTYHKRWKILFARHIYICISSQRNQDLRKKHVNNENALGLLFSPNTMLKQREQYSLDWRTFPSPSFLIKKEKKRKIPTSSAIDGGFPSEDVPPTPHQLATIQASPLVVVALACALVNRIKQTTATASILGRRGSSIITLRVLELLVTVYSITFSNQGQYVEPTTLQYVSLGLHSNFFHVTLT